MNQTRILLIEYDPLVQTLLTDVLADAGYEVYPTIHDADLAAIVEQFAPTMAIIAGGPRGRYTAGWKTAEVLHAINPRLALIMISTNPRAVREIGRTMRGMMFATGLRKPFANHELLAAVAAHATAPQIEA